MKQIYIVCALALSMAFTTSAQQIVTVDGTATWNGYANVFETDANGGGFAFGSGWAIPDLKSTVDAGANTVVVQPNFNTWGDGTDPFWVDQTTGEGNKVFEANTFIENNALAGDELFFRGTVNSNTLDAGYVAVAFIKVFNADFSVLKEETQPLVEGEVFTVSYTNVEAADTVVQYGFKVTGLNADPANEGALGSIEIGEAALSVDDANAIQLNVFPNPSNNQWTINTNAQVITAIEIFDVVGKKVISLEPNTSSTIIDASKLTAGVYIASVTSNTGTTSVKLIKS